MNSICSILLGMLTLTAQADPTRQYDLAESAPAGSQVRERLHMKVTGKIRTEGGTMDMAGQALLEFEQKTVELGPDQLPAKIVRFYPDARAKFVVGKGEDSRQLRTSVRYTVGLREENALKLWSPGGPLTSDERELIEDVIDTTRLAGLLPGKAVAIGESWEPQSPVLQALCNLQNFIESKVQCTLESIDENHAVIAVSGSVHGLAMGAEVKSKIAAKVLFHLTDKRIDQVQWGQTDSRGPSPIAPAGDYSVTIAITRTTIDSEKLTEAALASVSMEPQAGSLLLEFADPQGRYRFYHDRGWHVTMLQADTAVLRRLEGNAFVGQLNIKVIKDSKVGVAVTADQMQNLVVKAAGWQVDEVLRIDELPTDGNFRLHMLAAKGKLGEVALAQRHYLVNANSGEQVMFSFVTDLANEQQLESKDLGLVSSIEFPRTTAAKPTGPVK